MKFKRIIIGVAVSLLVVYGVLAYIFMWPPVVTNIRRWQSAAQIISSQCTFHLKQLDAALNQWGLEHGKHTGDPVTFEQLQPYFPNGDIPTCPFGGKYSVSSFGSVPTCSLATNPPSFLRIRRYVFFYEETYTETHYLP